MFLERRRTEHRLPLRIDDDGGAVEQQFVVAADLIHIDERRVEAAGDLRKQLVARFPLAGVERGGGDIQKDARLLPGQLIDRVVAVELDAQDLVVEPVVLADGDADARPRDVRRLHRSGRLEVAQFVEDVVSRQQRFVLLLQDLAVLGDDRAVVQRFCGSTTPDTATIWVGWWPTRRRSIWPTNTSG